MRSANLSEEVEALRVEFLTTRLTETDDKAVLSEMIADHGLPASICLQMAEAGAWIPARVGNRHKLEQAQNEAVEKGLSRAKETLTDAVERMFGDTIESLRVLVPQVESMLAERAANMQDKDLIAFYRILLNRQEKAIAAIQDQVDLEMERRRDEGVAGKLGRILTMFTEIPEFLDLVQGKRTLEEIESDREFIDERDNLLGSM